MGRCSLATTYTVSSKLICELHIGVDFDDVNNAISGTRNPQPVVLRQRGKGQVSSMQIIVGITKSVDPRKEPKWIKILFRATAKLDTKGLHVGGKLSTKHFVQSKSGGIRAAALKPQVVRIPFSAHGYFNLQKELRTDCITPKVGDEWIRGNGSRSIEA